MNYRVEISPIAVKNIEDAVNFYTNNVSKEVALRFLFDYNSMVKSLKNSPHFQIKYKDYRALPFKKFPFIAFFQVDEKQKSSICKRCFSYFTKSDKVSLTNSNACIVDDLI